MHTGLPNLVMICCLSISGCRGVRTAACILALSILVMLSDSQVQAALQTQASQGNL